jgi:hypothetical protein
VLSAVLGQETITGEAAASGRVLAVRPSFLNLRKGSKHRNRTCNANKDDDIFCQPEAETLRGHQKR